MTRPFIKLPDSELLDRILDDGYGDGFADVVGLIKDLIERYKETKEELERWKLGTHLLLNPEGTTK